MADQTEKEKQLLEDMVKLSKEIERLNQSSLDIDKAQAELKQKELSALQDQVILEKEIVKNRELRLNELEEEMKLLLDAKENSKEEQELLQLRLEYIKLQLEQEKALGRIGEERYIELKKEQELTLKQLQQTKDTRIEEEKRKLTLREIGATLINITGEYGQHLVNQFKLNSMITNFGNMVSEILRTNEQLVKTTGQMNLLTADMVQNMGQFGVGYKEMGEATGQLFTSMTSFSNLNKQTQNDLALNAAKMTNLGVSTQTTAANFDLLNKALKFNSGEVGNISDKIAKAAIGGGITPAKALSELASAMPQLAANGKKAVDIFITLQKESKALGIEFSSLLGIVGEGFDTFEGAAEKAGRLNAILGGDYLNSVEMLNATEEERVQILRRSFEQSGKNFESLDRFEQKSIAAAMGLKDVTEAQKLFGVMSVEDKIKMEAQAASQEELTKAQEASADAMRQMQLAMSEFYIAAQPVAKVLKEIMTWFAEHPRVMTVVVAFFAVIAVVVKLSAVFAALITSLKALGFGVKAFSADVATSGTVAGQGVSNFAERAKAAVPVILAFGAAIAMIGAGVYIAATGIGNLVESFKGLDPAQLDAVKTSLLGFGIALGVLSAILIGVAVVAGAAAIPMLAFGAAILLIGGGVALAAVGMSKLVDSIAQLVSGAAAQGASVISEIATGVMALSVALASFSILGPLNLVGLLAVKNMISEIGEAINDLPSGVEFTAKVNNFKSVGETINVAAAASDKLEPAKQFIVAAKEYHVAQKDSKTAENDALLQALKKIVPSGEKSSSPATGTPVILRIENGPDLRAYVLGGKASIF